MNNTTITTEQIVQAVNLANDFRSALGAEPIDDLPKGVMADPKRCILARAFNFDCSITPGFLGQDGRAWFSKRKEANKFAELVGRDVEKIHYNNFAVAIPAEISDIANAFDSRLLPQYEEYR